jgi:hypothetical protein
MDAGAEFNTIDGLLIKSSAPDFKQRARSSLAVRAVTMMMGTGCHLGMALIRWHASMPSIPGIITSSKMTSG